VGPNSIPYSDGQWIPLKVNGLAVTDTAIVEEVPGLALQRGNGFVRVLLHGSLRQGKEIVDARIEMRRATIATITNDTGNNAMENPFDGIVNDAPGGDEATLATDKSFALFQTRVTGKDDAMIISWTAAASASSVSSTASASSAPSASSASSAATAATGLSAYWPMNDGTGNRVRDGSGNGNDATARGGTFWVNGKIEKGLMLDGTDDWIETPFVADVAQWTVAGWLKADAAPDGDNNGLISRGTNFQISWDNPE
jgi:hypothetical protein